MEIWAVLLFILLLMGRGGRALGAACYSILITLALQETTQVPTNYSLNEVLLGLNDFIAPLSP